MEDSKISNAEMKLTFTHPTIGKRHFYACRHQLLGDFRIALDVSSETYLFTNYYFEHKGTKLN
jgi:hypothetical protein